MNIQWLEYIRMIKKSGKMKSLEQTTFFLLCWQTEDITEKIFFASPSYGGETERETMVAFSFSNPKFAKFYMLWHKKKIKSNKNV